MAKGSNTQSVVITATSASTPDVIWQVPHKTVRVTQIVLNNVTEFSDTLTIGIIGSRDVAVTDEDAYFSNIRVLPRNPFKEPLDLIINEGDKVVAYASFGNRVTAHVSFIRL